MSVKLQVRLRDVVLLGALALGAASSAGSIVRAQAKPFPVTVSKSSAHKNGTSSRRQSYGSLPLSFEQNRGQSAPDVGYVAHGPGYGLALKPAEATFALEQRRDPRKKRMPARRENLHMQIVGASPHARLVADKALPGRVNYILGNDPSRWRSDIPTFGRVRCTDIYPGIDLVYYGNQKQLEYDFVVAPKADPAKIALRFAGARNVAIAKSGALQIALKNGSVTWRSPVAYQKVNGVRKPVQSRFVMRQDGRIGFVLARYDAARPVVIDPVLLYSTYIGGSGSDQAFGIAVDSTGSAYITGTTTSPNFAGAPSGFLGTSDAFVTKLNQAGTGIVYSTFLGGSGDTEAWSIAVDASGGAYVAGDTATTDFPTVHAFKSVNPSSLDAFVTRLNPAGSLLIYSTYLGGSATDTAQAIALGPNGNAYVTGYTSSGDFPVVGAAQATQAGGLDAFVCRIDTAASGSASLVYSTYLGGTGADRGFAIAVDSAGRFYVTGDTTSADFPVASAFQNILVSVQNAFITAFPADGSSFTYSTYLGGNGADSGFGIAVNGSQNVYVTGSTSSTDFPKRNPFQSVIGGGGDAFVARFNTALSGDASLIFSTYLGGSANDAGRSIAIDVWGNVYVAGDTDSNFAPFSGSDAFLAKFNATGNSLLYGTLFGGSNFESAVGLAIDPAGTAYITGYTNSTDFPVTQNAFQQNLAGTLNAFVAKIPTFTRLDINHDSQADLIFQNSNTGQMVYWLMNGDREVRYAFTSPAGVSPNFVLAGFADFNGDGNTDLIFQDKNNGDLAYWFLNGGTQTAVGNITPKNPGTNWQVVGTGDFNRDGYTDILFQNSATGDIYVWFMQGTVLLSGSYITPQNPGTGWKIVGTRDLNGDGQPDILFQNVNSGNLYVWYMHGTTLYAGGFLNPANPGTGWNAVGMGDINGDGMPEIFFQNASSGAIAYWVLDGANLAYVGAPRPSNPGGAVWRLAGPK